jgi:hypothetical protein
MQEFEHAKDLFVEASSAAMSEGDMYNANICSEKAAQLEDELIQI